ncbi:hypothetical protein KCP77_23965 [Salmonella enterica subsp. enterica]|nr:hypothetical protein KCP77_23965 [Salmonella enterica subsp. enterica]
MTTLNANGTCRRRPLCEAQCVLVSLFILLVSFGGDTVGVYNKLTR